MHFQKKTSIGRSSNLVIGLIKILLIFILVFICILFVDKIDFPSPNKKIEKIIPNENLKIIK
jgi:hypothetical protein|tara:strand:+ start:43 stop:228 length:186 start_codon:yes stop_codon:yes gene_type:complete